MGACPWGRCAYGRRRHGCGNDGGWGGGQFGASGDYVSPYERRTFRLVFTGFRLVFERRTHTHLPRDLHVRWRHPVQRGDLWHWEVAQVESTDGMFSRSTATYRARRSGEVRSMAQVFHDATTLPRSPTSSVGGACQVVTSTATNRAMFCNSLSTGHRGEDNDR